MAHRYGLDEEDQRNGASGNPTTAIPACCGDRHCHRHCRRDDHRIRATLGADGRRLAAAIQEIIDASLVPGAIDWNCCGVDLPPTGVIVGVRLPAGRTFSSPPAGLDDTLLSDGSDLPDNYQHGRFFVEAAPTHSTAESPLTAYFTYAPAEDAFVSTVPDLSDLLDTWVDGTGDRATPPTPAAFPTDRLLAAEYVGDPPRYLGLDVPYTGYCPCQPASDGNSVDDAIGRRPATFGTDVHLFHYPDDDISIVLHYNSNTWADRSQIEPVLADIRTTVAASN